ncbi:HTH-type transcriptional regulator RutR [Tatumella ptyseos]|uniref:HTH-type transcriptional regulator RutR n=1 Tax=Tatumella ptyseos TaxID=82987 RepID=UPI0026EBBBA7|nr:HTH-type transcriptional regulator RutR [Tatumella ptyseos]WKX28030.1 HTH-type transcriptional regulator RutR [Tatumella ptyseos]
MKERRVLVSETKTQSSASRRSRAANQKRRTILSAALPLFSQFGLHGTSLERIAESADVSKTNLLYYFPSKEALYIALLEDLLEVWLAPLKAFAVEQDAITAIEHYILLKLTVSRDHPAASKLFCLEMLQGAPLLTQTLHTALRQLVEEKSAIIQGWVDAGQLAPIDPLHLIFTLWATTQHYADFGVQVAAISGKTLDDPEFFQQTFDNVKKIIVQGITRF